MEKLVKLGEKNVFRKPSSVLAKPKDAAELKVWRRKTFSRQFVSSAQY